MIGEKVVGPIRCRIDQRHIVVCFDVFVLRYKSKISRHWPLVSTPDYLIGYTLRNYVIYFVVNLLNRFWQMRHNFGHWLGSCDQSVPSNNAHISFQITRMLATMLSTAAVVSKSTWFTSLWMCKFSNLWTWNRTDSKLRITKKLSELKMFREVTQA